MKIPVFTPTRLMNAGVTLALIAGIAYFAPDVKKRLFNE